MNINGLGRAIKERSEREAEARYFWLGREARDYVPPRPSQWASPWLPTSGGCVVVDERT